MFTLLIGQNCLFLFNRFVNSIILKYENINLKVNEIQGNQLIKNVTDFLVLWINHISIFTSFFKMVIYYAVTLGGQWIGNESRRLCMENAR